MAQDWANVHAAWQWAIQHGKVTLLDMALDGFCAAYYFQHYHEEGINLWRDTAAALTKYFANAATDDLRSWQQLNCRLLIKQARHLSALQKYAEAAALVEQILDHAGLGPETEFEALLIQGWIDETVNEVHERRRAKLNTLVNSPRMQGEYWCIIATYKRDHGDVQEAYDAGHQALLLYESIEDYVGQALALRNIAISCVHLNKLTEASQHLERAMPWAQQRQDLSTEASLHEIAGMVYSRLGDHGAAIEAFTLARDSFSQLGKSKSRQSMVVNLALELAFVGRYAEARQQYESALEFFSSTFQRDRPACYIYLNLGLLCHTIGEQQAALQATEQALTLARELHLAYLEGYALTNLGYIHAALDCCEEAERAYLAALAIREELDETVLALETKAGLARLAFSCGNLPVAQEWIAPILTYLEDGTLDGAEEPLRIYLTCYRLLCAAGDDRAAHLQTQMQTQVQLQADRISDPELRQSFLLQVPYHRAIMNLG
ncbi:MAG: tetratricopeptide repeat protein [Caldilineaceae bacterium]